MYTYESSLISTSAPARANVALTEVQGSVSITAAAANGNTLGMFTLPANAILLDLIISCTDIDTDGSPTVLIDVGISGDTDKFINDATAGRAGGVDRLNNPDGFLYSSTSEVDVYATIVNPTTGATGTFKFAAFYTFA